MLAQRIAWYKSGASEVPVLERDMSVNPNSYVQQANQLPALKMQFPWLKEVPSQCLQQVLKDLDKAFKGFFKKKTKFPKFKRKGEHDRFRIPQGLEVSGNRVKLPKLDWVKFRKSQDIQDVIKNATISKSGKHWFISFCRDVEMTKTEHESKSAVGVDVGIAQFATLSDGKIYKGIEALKGHFRMLKRLQKSLSSKKLGSSKWKKIKEKLCRLHAHISNIRRDYVHKVTTEISKNHAMVFVEDLKVASMSRSAKGNEEEPGKNVKTKSGLNRSILDQGWAEFFRQLAYKLSWRGGELRFVDPKQTSQRCSCCGHVSAKSRLSQSEYVCVSCKNELNADLNAAINILTAGHAGLACGGAVVRLPEKQEPEAIVKLRTLKLA